MGICKSSPYPYPPNRPKEVVYYHFDKPLLTLKIGEKVFKFQNCEHSMFAEFYSSEVLLDFNYNHIIIFHRLEDGHILHFDLVYYENTYNRLYDKGAFIVDHRSSFLMKSKHQLSENEWKFLLSNNDNMFEFGLHLDIYTHILPHSFNIINFRSTTFKPLETIEVS